MTPAFAAGTLADPPTILRSGPAFTPSWRPLALLSANSPPPPSLLITRCVYDTRAGVNPDLQWLASL